MTNPEAQKSVLENAPAGNNRILQEQLEGKVASKEWHRLSPTLTVCIVTTVNGFQLVGKSACADPANYNEEIGNRLAYADALNQLWPLEGYLLRERLWWESQPAQDSTAAQAAAA